MNVNTFHIHCLMKTSQIPLAKLSRLTGVKESLLKKIKSWYINMISSDIYNQFIDWYQHYIDENIKLIDTNMLYLSNATKWQLQDNQ